MIEKITAKDIATYGQTGVTLKDLKKVNVIYGNNGSGKTTLSEVISNADKFPSCIVEWKNKKMATYVYNRNFVKENFMEGPIKGIFTLGKESVDVLVKIDDLKEKINQHEDEIIKLLELEKDKTNEQNNLVKDFTKSSWRIKSQIDIDFKDLIKGFRNSQEKFMQKCVEEAQTNQRPLLTIDIIKTKRESLFDRSTELLKKKLRINYEEKLEKDSIFKAKIIGRDDVDISRLITKLQISDWVNQGSIIVKNTEGVCPFCQQTLPDSFEEKLNKYFDHTYEEQMKYLQIISQRYIDNYEKTIIAINEIINDGNSMFIDKQKLINSLAIINARHDENKLLIDQKMKEPSRSIKLVEIHEIISTINYEIEASYEKIDEVNNLIENSRSEKENLIKDAWRYIVEKNKNNFKDYSLKIEKINRTLHGIEERIRQKKQYKSKYEKELIQYQKQITSVQYSVDEINRILNSFGFKNFRLATTLENGNYMIVRENGDDANETLSEGEKTFITFLYFYQLIKGSNNIEDIIKDKVVVIDDPVSSLDTTVLFMVSSLVRQLLFDVKNNSSDIKQIFLFTHNIYFHKEVTYNKGKKNFGEGTYWILRKNNNITTIQYFKDNPIKTSYELLWKELNNIHNQSPITIQNTMRRIIENYFKFFGNMDIDELENNFDTEEKIVFRSLLSWLNDGSHSINEDLYVENNEDLIERYMQVFRNIFIKTNHQAHYEMMMMGTDSQENFHQNHEMVYLGVREAASGIERIE
ncbi:AAA family ATPase [Bacillus sp. FJAT-26390]|uniref:AAA family ATPase n=1 Tax=Bacillus sp. FJAT-26390 TaxID=1743142 RepID=UPI000807C485|nr:AAA family ATPase [Bacillus sp. FJAT-26390]OBZ13642.1 hypothetical protein A7975_12545 [Bacillus sp. FJAT-26390]